MKEEEVYEAKKHIDETGEIEPINLEDDKDFIETLRDVGIIE